MNTIQKVITVSEVIVKCIIHGPGFEVKMRIIIVILMWFTVKNL